ncbi:LIM homeobox transcription factor 1-alpha [Merluccius polli]|uniref:LIM homeobox transcription factor 1-alpha n=1 Tax=Merluccius polli TaxID=89951 RepID=A0AA47MVY9_MERPO|nr:LIM homeobox transcription factor 1-alpha [Merluccius polli]
MDQRQAVCAGCHSPIRERFLLRVGGGLWHEACVRCAACGSSLSSSCFLRDRKLYCKRDYLDLFAVRCGGCAEAVSPADLVMRAGSVVFHLRCFACSACSCRLQTGDRCVLRDGQLLCARDHYHRCLASPACSDTDKSEEEEEEVEEEVEEEEEEEVEKVAGRPSRREDLESSKRPKRPRTILTTQQRRAFKASFEVSSKPCRKVRETLATETGLSVRVVQVWFQNQRAKMKKLARRQQQQQDQQTQKQQVDQSSHGTDTIMSLKVPPCGDLTPNQDPLGSSSYHHYHHHHHHHHPHPHPHPNHHPHQEQHLGLTRLDPQGFDMDPFRQGLTPPQMPGDHMNPYGLYGDTLEGDVLCPLADTECLSLGDSSLLTPIDRLYSMQDSYFTS